MSKDKKNDVEKRIVSMTREFRSLCFNNDIPFLIAAKTERNISGDKIIISAYYPEKDGESNLQTAIKLLDPRWRGIHYVDKDHELNAQ